MGDSRPKKRDQSQLTEGVRGLYSPYMGVLREKYGSSIGESLRDIAEECVDDHRKRIRRFVFSAAVLGIVVLLISGAIAHREKFPLMYAMPVVVVLYVVFVMLPVLDKTPRPSGRYRQRLYDATAEAPFRPIGIRFDCLRVEDARRMTLGGACFTIGSIALLTWQLSHEQHEALMIVSLIAFYFGAIVVLPMILVGLAQTELIPRTALTYPPERDAFTAVSDLLITIPYLTRCNETQRFMLARLEDLADAFETRIPRVLGIRGENSSSEETLGRFQIIASDIRSLMPSLALPDKTTHQLIVSRLVSTGGALASKRYGNHLGTINGDSQAAQPRSRTGLAFALIGKLLLAFAPGAILVGVSIVSSKDKIGLDPHVQASLTVFSVSWALATLTANRSGVKGVVSMTKDLSSMVTAAKKPD